MKHLGIDYGTKRIGLSLSDPEGRVAFPLATITSDSESVSQIDWLVKKETVEKIVLGESRDFKGEANKIMEDIEQFKKDLEVVTKLPVEYEREFFTSSLAARQFAPDGSRKENPSQAKLDASSAALILQSYLDRTNSHA